MYAVRVRAGLTLAEPLISLCVLLADSLPPVSVSASAPHSWVSQGRAGMHSDCHLHLNCHLPLMASKVVLRRPEKRRSHTIPSQPAVAWGDAMCFGQIWGIWFLKAAQETLPCISCSTPGGHDSCIW